VKNFNLREAQQDALLACNWAIFEYRMWQYKQYLLNPPMEEVLQFVLPRIVGES